MTNVFNQTPAYILPVSPGADTYQLTSNSPNLFVDATATPGLPVGMMATQAGNYTITLTTSNSCGTAQAIIYVTAEDCGDFGNFRVMQNPVESQSLVIIETENGQSSLDNPPKTSSEDSEEGEGHLNNNLENEQVSLELYDFSGNLLKAKKFNRNKINGTYPLNVSELENSKYFIRITYITIKEVYQVIRDK